MSTHLIFRLYLCLGCVLLIPSLTSAATLGVPGEGSTLSGIGPIRGWKCEATGALTVRFFADGSPVSVAGTDPLPLLYGSARPDVLREGACPDADVGFVAVINWGELGDGAYTAVVYDNGVEFDRNTFTVVTTGEKFLEGARARVSVRDFPRTGETATFEWNQGTQHLEMVSVQTRSVDGSIVKYLTGPVAAGKSPGLIAAIIDEEGVRAIASAGVRKQGSPEKFTINDQVHIGSNTKAMTSAMLATLVEDGTFVNGWETTLVEVLPELVGEIHAGYHHVTLWQLVSHAGGIARDPRNWWAHLGLEITERRYTIMKETLTNPPAGAIGKFQYSNLGYLVAGVMAEQLTGKSWETLMEERLFTPLGMYSAGFGAPGTRNEVDQPWGHRRGSGNAWVPAQFDNPAALGPAGTVHVSIADWAKFIQLWFPNSEPKILDREALNTLITPRSGESAAGWFAFSRSWAADLALFHDGTNLYWYSTLWVAPNRERAYLVVANSAEADFETGAMLDPIIWSLINHSQ